MEEILLNDFDLSTICRLCLSEGAAVLNIFDFSTGLMNEVADVIMKCAPVHITRCEEMPNFICQSCNTQLERSHQFQKTILESDKTLRRYLQQLQTSNRQIKAGRIQRPSEDSLIHNSNTDIKIKCESPEFQDVSDININLKEEAPSNYTSVHKRNEEIYLKSEIKEEPIDDHSSIPTECTDNLIDTLSQGDDGTEKKLKNSGIEERSDNFTADLTEHFTTFDGRTKNTGEKSYQCDICNKCFNKLDTLRKHQRVHTGEKPYQCDVCNKCFRESGHLKSHQRVHTGEKPYQCDVCNKCFNRSDTLRKHQRVHTGEKPYHCDVCNKCFSQLVNLTTHQRLHTDKKPFQCDVCNKCFSHVNSLISHQRVHTGVKLYQCDVCNKCFRESCHLRNHQRVHTGEKPFECDVCKKCFNKLDNLRKHQRVHTGEKPYQCDVCSKCFRESGHLRNHKRVHTGEKPYQCTVCNKSFNKSDTLKKHIRVHTGEKPYQCDICNKQFAQSGDLNTHKRRHSSVV